MTALLYSLTTGLCAGPVASVTARQRMEGSQRYRDYMSSVVTPRKDHSWVRPGDDQEVVRVRPESFFVISMI